MSFPASLTTRVFQGGFVTYPDGAAAKGSVRIVLNTAMQGPADHLFVVPFDITIPLDENGRFSVILPANDDPQWTPSSYKVTVMTGGDPNCRRPLLTLGNMPAPAIMRATLRIPYNQTGPIYADEIFNIPVPARGESYILLASKGAPGGVASLDSNGKVLANQLPTGAGGDVSWLNLTDKPSTFPPVAHTHSTAEVSGLDGALADKASVSALAGKASTSDLTTGLAGKADSSHTHITGQVTGLDTALSNKASTTDLSTGLAGKSNTGHTHAFTDITDKPTVYPHDEVTWDQVTNKPTVFPGAGGGSGGTVEWTNVQNKPSSFPHDPITFTEITGKPSVYPATPTDWANITSKPSVFPADPPAFSAITGKPASYPSTWTDVSGKPTTFAPSAHGHVTSDISGLDTTLAGKALTTDLTTGLAGKANTSHTHAQTDISGLGTALSAKADQSAVTTALSSKADSSALTSGLAGKADLVGGVLPTSQLPSIAVIDFLGSVSTQTAMLALTGQKGDWCIRTDLGQTWIITGSDPTQLASWTAMPIGTSPVQTVNGQTGAVVLGKTDVGLGSVDNTSDANKPVSTAQAIALALKAPLASPTFTGTVSGVTAAMVGLGSVNNTADTAKPVSTAQATAIALKADLASPTLTGTPAAPTATAGTSTTQLATTAFVTTADALKAPLASPTLTGTPAAPTATAGTSTTQLATTAFVTTADNLKAPLASPALTGTPTAPTAAVGTNTTQVATTAFVQAYTVKAIVLSAAGSIPGGTPANTIVFRTAT